MFCSCENDLSVLLFLGLSVQDVLAAGHEAIRFKEKHCRYQGQRLFKITYNQCLSLLKLFGLNERRQNLNCSPKDLRFLLIQEVLRDDFRRVEI